MERPHQRNIFASRCAPNVHVHRRTVSHPTVLGRRTGGNIDHILKLRIKTFGCQHVGAKGPAHRTDRGGIGATCIRPIHVKRASAIPHAPTPPQNRNWLIRFSLAISGKGAALIGVGIYQNTIGCAGCIPGFKGRVDRTFGRRKVSILRPKPIVGIVPCPIHEQSRAGPDRRVDQVTRV